jgi:hypothetical protein
MSTDTVSPLRKRMMDDMNARKLGAHSQRSHISSSAPNIPAIRRCRCRHAGRIADCECANLSNSADHDHGGCRGGRAVTPTFRVQCHGSSGGFSRTQ